MKYLSTNGMAFEENGLAESQTDTLDVDGVAGDGDTVPSSAHRTVGAAPELRSNETET